MVLWTNKLSTHFFPRDEYLAFHVFVAKSRREGIGATSIPDYRWGWGVGRTPPIPLRGASHQHDWRGMPKVPSPFLSTQSKSPNCAQTGPRGKLQVQLALNILNNLCNSTHKIFFSRSLKKVGFHPLIWRRVQPTGFASPVFHCCCQLCATWCN